MTLNKSNLTAGVAFGLIGMLGFSGTLVATRAAVVGFSPTTITSGRIVIAGILAIITLVYIGKFKLPDRRLISPILWMGMGLAVGFPFFVALALESVPAVHGAVAVGLAPAATAVIAYLRLGDRPKSIFWAACAVGFFGVFYYALDAGGGHLVWADFWLLLALLSVGYAYVEGGRVSIELGGTVALCWSMIFLAPCALAILLWSANDLETDSVPFSSWVGMAYVGIVSMFLASVFWYRGLAAGGVSRIGQINLLLPLVALLWSWLFLDEEITATALICSIVVFVAMVMSQKSRSIQVKNVSFGLSICLPSSHLNDSSELRIQPIDATHALNRSAGDSYSNVFLGLSLSRLATLFSCACE